MDKLSNYLRFLDSQDQEEAEERDYYMKALLMRGFKYQRPTKTKS